MTDKCNTDGVFLRTLEGLVGRCDLIRGYFCDVLRNVHQWIVWGDDGMTPEERKAYWVQEIVFDCPITNNRHSVNYCFENCEFSGTSYHDNCAWVKCGVDSFGEREVHDGRTTRDN